MGFPSRMLNFPILFDSFSKQAVKVEPFDPARYLMLNAHN